LVATYIPESDYAPHQTVSDLTFYMRAGSNFVRVPRVVLAGMFGKKPQPETIHKYVVAPAKLHPNNAIDIMCDVFLYNNGRGIAEDVFINFHIMDRSGPNVGINFLGLNRDEFNSRFSLGTFQNFISRPGIKLPPKAMIRPSSILLTLRPPCERRLMFDGLCGCAGGPSLAFSLNIPADTLQAETERAIASAPERRQTNIELGHDLAVTLIEAGGGIVDEKKP
jgi:hypothetical protein